jgi:hypothetical protein
MGPLLSAESANTIINDILTRLNTHELISHQLRSLLELLGEIIETGTGGEGNDTPQQHSKAAASSLSCGIGRMELRTQYDFSIIRTEANPTSVVVERSVWQARYTALVRICL